MGREGSEAALTLALQDRNQIGDRGACGLGEGLKANSSLQHLALVSRCIFLFAETMQGGGGKAHARSAEQQ